MKRKYELITRVICLIVAAILLSSCAKDAPTRTISSENKENRVTVESKVQAIIPPNTVPEGTQIVITELDQLIDHDFAGFRPVGLFDISSSGEDEFGNAVTLEFEYNKKDLDPTLDASDQLAIAYFDELYNRWQETDFEIDETNSRVIVKTNHLSLWSLFVQDSKYVTLSWPNFIIYFNKDAQAPAIGTIVSGDPIYEYATIVRTGLYDAYKAYGDLLFKLPGHTKVYIDSWGSDKEAEWGWFSKNIEIPLTYIFADELKMVSAHELFHAVQNQYVNFAAMAMDRWWMEATADYAAAYVATNYGLKEKLKFNYLNVGITDSETFHTYQTAHFIKYLVDAGYDFEEMFSSVMTQKGGVLETLNSYCASKKMPLATHYDHFAYSVLFENSILTQDLGTDVYTDLVSNKLELNLDAPTELSELVNVGSSYAATLAGIKLISDQDADFEISLKAIEPTSGVKVQYILADGPNKDNVVNTGFLDHNAIEMTVKDGNYLYFLVTNFSPQNGFVTVVVNQESKPQPYANQRTVLIYNDTFLVDVEFNLSANTLFAISREIVNGEVLFLQIDFDKSNKDIVIDVEAIVSNLRFSSEGDWGENHEPVINEMGWVNAAGDIQGSETSLTIPAGDTGIKSIGYSLIIDIHNTEENTYYWGGAANVVQITVRIMD